MVDLVSGTDFYQLRRAIHDVRERSVAADGQIHPGICQVLLIVDGSGINCCLHQLQRERNKFHRDHGVQLRAERFIEGSKTLSEILVIVYRKVPRMDVVRKRGQRAGQREHRREQAFGMRVARFIEVPEHGKGGVNGIEQPKGRNIGGGEIGQALILLPAHSGYCTGSGRQNLYEPARNGY